MSASPTPPSPQRALSQGLMAVTAIGLLLGSAAQRGAAEMPAMGAQAAPIASAPAEDVFPAAACRRAYRYAQFQDLISQSRYRITPANRVVKISLSATGVCTAERPSKASGPAASAMELGREYPVLERFEDGAQLLGRESLRIEGSRLVKVTTSRSGATYRAAIATVRSLY